MTNNNFSDSIEIREIEIQKENYWHWLKEDTGAFGSATDGPMRDWIEGHSKKYFTHVKNFDTVVTGGACCGMHVRFYAKMFKYVYAYEPDPRSFHCMVLNNPYDNVIKLNAAMGAVHEMVGLNRNSSNNIGTNTVGVPNEYRIPTISIDSLNLLACDLIQIDAEGMEEDTIIGAKETIMKYRPVVIAERFGGEDSNNLMKLLFGYKLIDKSFSDAIYIPE